ncbi:hypothetical protein GA0070558_16710 [Micromonospora haikouensis]|uniref:Uncharacterized protein n=1 Tax=Micromonospora haikouensis TaxID=686309 RepID=A0A1C4YS70_9ACTN|nr:hypothetical protein GA0070558_16710 [Micromonospora haikouensis]
MGSVSIPALSHIRPECETEPKSWAVPLAPSGRGDHGGTSPSRHGTHDDVDDEERRQGDPEQGQRPTDCHGHRYADEQDTERHTTDAAAGWRGASEGAAVGVGGSALPPYAVAPDDDALRASAASRIWLTRPNRRPMWAWMPRPLSFASSGQSAKSLRAVTSPPAGSTATGQVLSTCVTAQAEPASTAGAISTGPDSPAARAAAATRSKAADSTTACAGGPVVAAGFGRLVRNGGEAGRDLRRAGTERVEAGTEVRPGVPGPGQPGGREEQQADGEPDAGGGVPAPGAADTLAGGQVRYEQVPGGGPGGAASAPPQDHPAEREDPSQLAASSE